MFDLTPVCAFDGLLHVVGPANAGVTVQVVRGLSIVSVMERCSGLAERVRRLYGVDLPDGPQRVVGKDVAIVGVGPGAWLLLRQNAGAAAADLGDIAVVVDQSGGRGLLRLSGPRVVDLLAKGVFLDLHPDAFPVGAAASTGLAHVAVDLWRTGPQAFELLVPRSFAPAVAHWLEVSATEFGLTVQA